MEGPVAKWLTHIYKSARLNTRTVIILNVPAALKDERIKKTILWILAILGAAVAIAGIAYAVYRFVTPNYLKDFEEDFDEDFDDDFLEAEEIE